MKSEKQQSLDLKSHIQWVFPTLKVETGFGRSVKGHVLVAIYFGISLFKSELDTLNKIGLEIHHIKSIDDKLIAVVYDRRTDRS